MTRMVRSAAVTPQEWRALADKKDAEALEAAGRGDVEAAFVASHVANTARAVAKRLEEGTPSLTTRSVDVQDKEMLTSQLARRGRAVARAAASNDLLRAIAADPRWGSARVYARTRLKIAPSSLTHYMSGVSPCPRAVDEKIRKDFPTLSWTWKKGVVE